MVDWLMDFITECSGSLSQFAPPTISNDNHASVTLLDSENFNVDNRYLRLRYYGIHEAIAKGRLAIEHMAGEDMIADG